MSQPVKTLQSEHWSKGIRLFQNDYRQAIKAILQADPAFVQAFGEHLLHGLRTQRKCHAQWRHAGDLTRIFEPLIAAWAYHFIFPGRSQARKLDGRPPTDPEDLEREIWSSHINAIDHHIMILIDCAAAAIKSQIHLDQNKIIDLSFDIRMNWVIPEEGFLSLQDLVLHANRTPGSPIRNIETAAAASAERLKRFQN